MEIIFLHHGMGKKYPFPKIVERLNEIIYIKCQDSARTSRF